ncbi:MAG: hypothetical protein ACLFPU_07695 [Dehalococcoidia bacterium]
MNEQVNRKRANNEKKFSYWAELPNSGRRYWDEVPGRFGFKARYVKEVNGKEETTRFYQEIYDAESNLIEIHEKFPEDSGHRRLKGGRDEG